MLRPKKDNHAFIDAQNLHLGIRKLGWNLDYRRFRVYLREKYGVSKAYLFIGFVAGNVSLYNFLREAGFIIVFRPTFAHSNQEIKGNVDADMVLKTITDFDLFDKAVIVSSDGDFYSLVDYLYWYDKLEVVLSPDEGNCATILKKSARKSICYMGNLRQRLEYKKRTA
jgi:uncharacterized LabA/DUF88 family protein